MYNFPLFLYQKNSKPSCLPTWLDSLDSKNIRTLPK